MNDESTAQAIVNSERHRVLFLRSSGASHGADILHVGVILKETGGFQEIIRFRDMSGEKHIWRNEIADVPSAEEFLIAIQNRSDQLLSFLVLAGMTFSSDHIRIYKPDQDENEIIEDLLSQPFLVPSQQ